MRIKAYYIGLTGFLASILLRFMEVANFLGQGTLTVVAALTRVLVQTFAQVHAV
jgi:hypothetical protein